MLKKEDKIFKISNIIFTVIIVLSLLSILSLLFTGYKNVEGRTKIDYFVNLVLLLMYLVSSILILYISNKKINFYKNEYSIPRKIFNLFVLISCLSIVMMFTTIILSKVFLNIFSWYSLLTILLGYIPIYVITYIEVDKDKLLSIDNDKKTNIGNLIIILLLMNYSINVIILMLQMIFEINDIMITLPSVCISFIWIFIILVAYNLINKKHK